MSRDSSWAIGVFKMNLHWVEELASPRLTSTSDWSKLDKQSKRVRLTREAFQQKDALLLGKCIDFGMTPFLPKEGSLLHLCEDDHLDFCTMFKDWLLPCVNSLNDRDETPLAQALVRDRPRACSLLLSWGACPRTPVRGFLPMQMARTIEALALLMRAGASWRDRIVSGLPMWTVWCEPWAPDLIEYCLENGLDPNSVAPSGATLLQLACYNGCRDSVRRLLARGADPNKGSKDFGLPLYHAAQQGAFDSVELLLRRGASATVKNVFTEKTAGEMLECILSRRPDWLEGKKCLRLLMQ